MKKDYANELDLLRFLAAIGVAIFHIAHRSATAYGAFPLPYQPFAGIADYGYMGVDLFFIISGFVVIASAQHATIGSFVMGRISRLCPAFWCCCTIAFLVLLAFGNSSRPMVWAYLANMTMQPHPFGVRWLDATYWTLGIEIRFYTMLAILILIRQIGNAERWCQGWLAVTVMLTMFPVTPVCRALLVPFASYFIAGMTFQCIRAHGMSAARLVTLLVCYVLSLYNAMATIKGQPSYAHLSDVVACFVTTAFYAVFYLIATRKTGRLARSRWVTAGLLTYPLYLIHQPVCTVALATLAPGVNQHLVFCGILAVALLMAYLIHHCVERPAASRLRNLPLVVRRFVSGQPAR